MGRKRLPNRRETRIQQLESKLAAAQQSQGTTPGAKSSLVIQHEIPYAWLWLAIAFLLPNLGALACGVAWDDDSHKLFDALNTDTLAKFAHLWTSGYWRGSQSSVQAFRPVAETLWALLVPIAGTNNTDQHPFLFHVMGLALGLVAVILVYQFLLEVQTSRRVAFIAATLFALFPIHTEVTSSIVGSAESLAVCFGLGALLLYYRERSILALLLFALAVFSKESAAAFAALPLVFPHKQNQLWRKTNLLTAAGAGGVIAAALAMHHFVSGVRKGSTILNPLLDTGPASRILTALWTQFLYLGKIIAPVHLLGLYTRKQIHVVTGMNDWRAWAGITLLVAAVFVAVRWREFRSPIACYAVLFAPTANILFPIGTIFGERLAYAPSLGVALLLALLLAQYRHWKTILVIVALIFGVRTGVRNLDWRSGATLNADFPGMSDYVEGLQRQQAGDLPGAIASYSLTLESGDYAPAYCNRGLALAKLGGRDRAVADLKKCEELNGPLPDELRAYVENNAVGASPKSPRELLDIAIQRREAGDAAGAVFAYTDFLAIMPEYAPAYCNRGVALAYLARRAEAISDFKRCQRDGTSLPPEVLLYIEQPEAPPPAVKRQEDFLR